jgi:excisionase family DNA binding protein
MPSTRTATPAEKFAPLAVSPQTAGDLLGIRLTRVYKLMRAGELLSFCSGRSRRITMESIHAYIERQLAASAASGWSTWQHNPQARRQRQEAAKFEQHLGEE